MENKKLPVVYRVIDGFCGWTVAVLMAGLIVVIFLQVFFRFVIHGSLVWSEEASRYMMAFIVFIGGALGVKDRVHMGVDFFVNLFPSRVGVVIRMVGVVLSAVFSAVLTILAFRMVRFTMLTGQNSPAMRIPMWVIYLSVLLGGLLMTVNFIRTGISTVTGEEPAKADAKPTAAEAMKAEANTDD